MFKNNDIIDNINIFGSNNLTPIIDQNFNFNPYSKTLWNNEEENKQTVNMLQTDGKENIHRRLAERRKQQKLTLPLKNIELSSDLDLKSKISSNRGKKGRFSLVLEDFELQEDERILVKSPHLSMNKPGLLLLNKGNETKTQSVLFDKTKKFISSRVNTLNLPLYKDVGYINTKEDFISFLEVFYRYEIDYISKLEIIIDIYQIQFQKTAKNIIEKQYPLDENNNEVLLFGNIKTMVELSKAFSKNFIHFLSEFFNINENDKKFWNIIRKNLMFSDLKQLKIFLFLNNEFNKWKQCYSSYIIMHHRQLRYFDFLLNNPATKCCINTWLKKCETSLISFLNSEDSSSKFLITLLSEPLQRIFYWQNFIECLSDYAPTLFSIEDYDTSLKFLDNITKYNKNLKTLIASTQIYSSEVFTYFIPVTKLENASEFCGGSATSSVYSPYTETSNLQYTLSIKKTERTENTKNNSINFIDINMDYNNHIYQESTQLTELICDFENFHLHLCSLEKKLSSIQFSDYVYKLHYYTGKWKQVYFLEKTNSDCTNIYELYQQKLETQLIHITNLQNIKLQSIKKNIHQYLTYCDIINKIITERNRLINALKSIKVSNIKFNAMFNQINHLANTLKINLIEFMKIASSFIKFLLLKINDLYLMFLKLMVGNSDKLEMFINNYESKEIDFGDNFDIIQQYSINRNNTKQAVKDHIASLNLNEKCDNILIGNSYFRTKTFRCLFS